jgi:hypothetical protein
MHAVSVHGVEVCILILITLGFIQGEGRGITTHFRMTPHHFFTSQTACNPIIFHPRLEFSYARAGKDFAK